MEREPGPLYGPAELAEALGVSRKRMQQIVRNPTFPAPFQKLIGTTVWLRSEVDAWIAEYRQPRPIDDEDEYEYEQP